MKSRDAVLGLLVALVWGVNFVVIDEGLHGVPPLLFAAVRFALVVPLVLVVPRPDASWARVLGVGLAMSAGQFGFVYLALGLGMPAGIAPLLLQAQVPLTALLAAAALRERVRGAQIAGFAIACAGLGIIAAGRSADTTALGIALTLAAAGSLAVGNVLARGVRSTNGLSLVAWGSIAVPVPLLAASALLEGPAAWAAVQWGWTQTASTAFTVLVSTVAAFSAWNGLLARYPAATVVPFGLLIPVFGLAASWGLQGRRPSAAELVGGAVLLAGAAIGIRGGRTAGRREPPAQEEAGPAAGGAAAGAPGLVAPRSAEGEGAGTGMGRRGT